MLVLGLSHDRFCAQRRLVAHARPVIRRFRVAAVLQIGPGPVGYIEKIAEHFHGIPLLAFTEQGRHADIQELP
jgi:hypothetical protein